MRSFTETQLDEGARHVDHAMYMFLTLLREVGLEAQAPRQEWMQMALLESLVVHNRELLEFFRADPAPTGSAKHDIFALDYLPGASHAVVRRLKSEPEHGIWKKASKLGAHLTLDRSNYPEPWAVSEFHPVKDRIVAFAEELGADRFRGLFPRAAVRLFSI